MLRFAGYLAFLLILCVNWATPEAATKRVALVVGNSAYEFATPLGNPKNDAEAISGKLSKLGFTVVKGVDLTHVGFAGIVSEFRAKLKGADVGLFFYAGHGLQVQGENYLAPIDAELKDEPSLEFEAVRLSTILKLMERETRTNVVFLDACRDNPLARNLARSMGTRSAAIGRGLARVESGLGTLIAFATQPGNVALDGEGNNSPFTQALLKHIETPGLEVEALMRRVRVDVMDATRERQVPWNNSSLTGAFMFNDKAPEKADDLKTIEMALWQAANSSRTKSLYAVYLKNYPHGTHADEARSRIAALEKAEAEQQASEKKAREQAEAERRAKAEAERQKLRAERDQMAKERADFAERLRALEAQTRAQAEKDSSDKKQNEEEVAAREKEVAVVRDAYLVKLKALEVQAQSLAAQIEANAQERKAAALSVPDASRNAKTDMDIGEMTLVLQSELKRVGCDPGALDGDWGQQGRAALAQFNAHAKLNLSIASPSLEAIEAIRDKTGRVCPEETERASLPGSQAPGQAPNRTGPPGGLCKDGNMAHCKVMCSKGFQRACNRLARGR